MSQGLLHVSRHHFYTKILNKEKIAFAYEHSFTFYGSCMAFLR